MKPASGETIETSSFACRAGCNEFDYYFNGTAKACLSCDSFDADYCPPQFHLSGAGCYGNQRPFLYPLTNPWANAQAMCVQCDKSMPPAGKWLSITQSPCAILTCSVPSGLGATIYEYTPCGNTSDIVTRPCVLTCTAPRTYLSGSCQRTSTGKCKECTTNLPGSYMIANCTPTADAEWAQCSVPGTFCAGDGSVSICPMNQTSSPGAASAANCYCPVGTKSYFENGPCMAVRCSIAAPSRAPGASYGTSSYFLDFDSHLETKCYPCPSNSLSTLNDGIGIESCVCNSVSGNFWYNSIEAKQCVACPSSASACGGGFYNSVPDTCWRGVVSECMCVPPPFSVLGDAVCSPGPNMCGSGFVWISSNAKPVEDSTGSAVHCGPPRTPLTWSIPLRKDAAPTNDQWDYTIRHLTTTSDWGTWGDTANWQFVVWTVASPKNPSVFAMPAPPHGFAESDVNLYNPYGSMSSAWNILPYYSSAYVIEEIAVAQWVVPQTPARLLPGNGADPVSFPTHVGAVVRVVDSAGGSALRLYVNALRVDVVSGDGKPQWDSGLKTIPLSLVANASTVDLGHAYMAAGAISTFYLAYNKPTSPSLLTGGCGIVAVSIPTTGSETVVPVALSGSDGRTLEAAAFMSTPNGDGVQIYMIFATTSNKRSVRMVRWISGTLTAEADELFFAGGALRVRALHIARPDVARYPVFTALVETQVRLLNLDAPRFT